jgi:hypothetical protein
LFENDETFWNQTPLISAPDYTHGKGKRWSCPCAKLIKHYAMKMYGGVDI